MGIKSGYAYEKKGKGGWGTCSDDCWEIVVVDADAGARWRGWRMIDDAACNVYQRSDGKFVAQTVASGGEVRP